MSGIKSGGANPNKLIFLTILSEHLNIILPNVNRQAHLKDGQTEKKFDRFPSVLADHGEIPVGPPSRCPC